MGQRLVVTIEKNERKLCNIYYHWGAYTDSALLHTKEIIDCIYNHKDESEEKMLLRLIRFCESQGGGIANGRNGNEWKYIQNLYPNETFKAGDISRNDGLISLSEKEMAVSQSWSEGDVYINLDTDQVDFCVYSGYDDLEEYIEARKEWDDEFVESELKYVPTFDFCLGLFDVSDIGAIIASLDAASYPNVIKCDSEICEMVC